jgi:hypothetical protein
MPRREAPDLPITVTHRIQATWWKKTCQPPAIDFVPTSNLRLMPADHLAERDVYITASPRAELDTWDATRAGEKNAVSGR